MSFDTYDIWIPTVFKVVKVSSVNLTTDKGAGD